MLSTEECLKRGRECANTELALRLFNKAWESLQQQRNDVAVLLTNRAICLARQGHHLDSLRCAGVAAHLDPEHQKAKFWRQKGLSAVHSETPAGAGEGGNGAGTEAAGSCGSLFASRQKEEEWHEVPGVVAWTTPSTPTANGAGSDEGKGEEEASSGATWQHLKDLGKEHFQRGEWGAADAKYKEALEAYRDRATVAEVLSSLARASFKTKAFAACVAHSAAGVLLPPATEECASELWVLRAQALEKLRDPRCLTAAAGVPVRRVREEADLIQQRWTTSQPGGAPPKTWTAEEYAEAEEAQRQSFEDSRGGDVPSWPTPFVMYQLASREEKRNLEMEFGPLVRRKPPAFHIDFPRERGWPVSTPKDVALCKWILDTAYADGTMVPWLMEHMMKEGRLGYDEPEKTKRFGGTESFRFYLRNKPWKSGDVMEVRETWQTGTRYSDTLRVSFCNNPPRKETLTRGKVHVAVGFTDLGFLLACSIVKPPGEGTADPGPLRFVGIDASPYCVAKSLVVLEMLKRGDHIPISHCLQAWYSSGWSAAASKSFRECTRAVMMEGNPEQRVMAYVCHWASAPEVPLGEVRHDWLKAREAKARVEIANLLRHKDRMALCQYYLTGDLFLESGSKAEVGSLAMWSVPPNSPPLADHESAFESVDIIDCWNLPGLKSVPQGLDIVTRLQLLIASRAKQLRRRLVEGKVEIQLRCAYVSPANASLVAEIAELHPHTMSWSNCADYMAPSKFHSLARACSAHGGTTHFAHSSKWVAEVIGTWIMDSPAGSRGEIIEAMHRLLASTHEASELKAFLLSPPYTNPLITTGYYLAYHRFQGWVSHFFRKEIAGDVRMGLSMIMKPFNPFARSAANVAMSWTYEENIPM